MKLLKRLEILEKQIQGKTATVIFKDGTSRRMQLQDVIPLMKMPEADNIESILDEGSQNGQLFDLLAGLIEESETDFSREEEWHNAGMPE